MMNQDVVMRSASRNAKTMLQPIPYVTLKAAITLDGKMASYSSDSKWITSEQAREDVHILRHQHAAILVGVNTVLIDDPQLTTRLPGGRNPVRIILDPTLRLPLSSNIVVDGQAPTWVFTTTSHDPAKRKALEEEGVDVIVTEQLTEVHPFEGSADVGRAADHFLAPRRRQRDPCFFERKLVDKVVIYVAPKLIGGRNARSLLGGSGIEKMSDAIDLADVSVQSLGKDFKFTGYPVFTKETR